MNQEQYKQLLEGISRELDIPPSKYQIAVQRYTAVGNWLKDGNYKSSTGEVLIYPQGSFRLGTIVRPVINGVESDYDIDLVCQLSINKDETNPEEIKAMVGDRLKENGTYLQMLDDESRRCWTLNYSEQDGVGFHMDILPSIAEEIAIIRQLTEDRVPAQMAECAIAISDKDKDGTYSWSSSNPNGYAQWFDFINQPMLTTILNEQKRIIFESNKAIYNKVEDVPDFLVKTPLQRAVQILKRHRDVRFNGSEWEEDKPISMIITTLSAKLYQNESDVYTTLKGILEKLNVYAGLIKPGYSLNGEHDDLQLITRRADGTWVISNPVNPAENFADRWHENNDKKARAFFQWVAWVYNDLIEIIENTDFERAKKLLGYRFGDKIIEKASKGVIGAVLASSAVVTTPHIQINKPSKPWGCK